MTWSARKIKRATGLALLLTAGLLAVAVTAAYGINFTGSSCYNGSCEEVIGSGLYISTTDTWASSPHCNQLLGQEQWDAKGYLTTYSQAKHVYGCSNYPMYLTWDTGIPSNDSVYGQSYYSGAWRGIATVQVHS